MHLVQLCSRTPHSLNDSNANPKVETTKEGVGVRSLTCNISKVDGHARAPGWGLGRVKSESIIHMNEPTWECGFIPLHPLTLVGA
jgi:hypothetical protein